MKPLNITAAALFLLGAACQLPAQKTAAPGALANIPKVALPSTTPTSGASSIVAPKTDIAGVESDHDRHMKTIWMVSLLVMAAGTTADAASSWHKSESNGLLASANGSFGGKGVGIKVGVAAAVILPQVLFRRHKELRGPFAAGNFAEGGIFTGAAIHNLGIHGK